MMFRLKTTLAITPLLFALAVPATAQDPTTQKTTRKAASATKTAAGEVSLIAENPLFVAHVDGPDKLRTRFLATNLGKLLDSNEFKDLLKPMFKTLEQMKKQAAGKMPVDLDELEKTIKGYSGRLSVAMHVTGKIDFQSSQPPFGFTVILSPDGVTDLKGLCEKCTKLVEEDGSDTAFDLEVEGKTFRCVSDSGGYAEGKWAAAIPFLHAGHAVMCVSTSLKDSLKMVLNPDQKPRFEHSPEFSANSLGLWINVAKVVALIEDGFKSQYGDDYADSPAKVALDMIGIRAIDTVSKGYRPLGPYVGSDTVVQFNGADRGIWGALFPKTRTQNPFLNSLPRTTSLAQTFHFDIGTLYAGVKKAWQALDETDAVMPMSWGDIESTFQEEFGFRLKEDFIDHLGASGILAQQISEAEAEDVDLDEDPDGSCLAFQVKNPEAFAKRIDAMLRKWGQHTGRKQEDYKGQTVYRLSPFGVAEVHYAVADRLFLVGWGSKGGSVLRSVLDAERDVKEGKEPAPLSSGLKARLRSTQPGYVELGWMNVPANMKVLVRLEDQLQAMMFDLPPELRTFLGMVDKMRPLLKTYHVDEELSLTRTRGNTVIFQTIW
jgi:hypothetical protein